MTLLQVHLCTGVINRKWEWKEVKKQTALQLRLHYSFDFIWLQPMSNQILNNILIYCWYNHSLKHNARTRQPKVSKKNHIQVT